MSDIVIIDFETLKTPEKRSSAKKLVVEVLVKHPEVKISVVNANFGSQPVETTTQLISWGFPVDVVSCNPMTVLSPSIVFKTMWAASIAEHSNHRIILVVDDDAEALQMWKDSGVEFTYRPEGQFQA